MLRTAVSVAVLSALLFAVRYASESRPIAPVGSPDAITPPLGTIGYDIEQLSAPTATGGLLRVLCAIMTHPYSPAGPLLRRALLNTNGVHKVRELAAQVGDSAPLMHWPLARLPTDEYDRHVRAAAAGLPPAVNVRSHSRFCTCPLPYPGDPAAPVYLSVEDYAKAPPILLQPLNHCVLHRPWTALPPSGYGACGPMFTTAATTPVEVAKAIIAGNEALAHLKAFEPIDVPAVLAQAEASSKRHSEGRSLGVWDGVPVAIKDEIDIKGYVTSDGTDWSKPPADKDDTIVARLRGAGAVIIGKTVMHEVLVLPPGVLRVLVGVQPTGYNSHNGGPFNPYDTFRYPGGSSSGSAVAVAAGLVPVAIGFDGGGSIRIPSSLSGVYGLSPTFTRVPFDSEGARTGTHVHAGPLAAWPRDIALSHLLLGQPEPGHFYSDLYGHGGPPPAHVDGIDRAGDLNDVRLGVMQAWFEDATPQVVAACQSAVNHLKKLGATVVDIDIPHMHALSLAHGMAISGEFALNHDLQYSSGHAFEPATSINLGLGISMTAQEFLACSRLRGWAFKYVQGLYRDMNLTAIVTPTTPRTAPLLSADAQLNGESNTAMIVQLMKYIFLGNLLGNPGMAAPVGYDTDGLPISLHMMGAHWQDAELIRLAEAL
eukprot:gene6029-1077_t